MVLCSSWTGEGEGALRRATEDTYKKHSTNRTKKEFTLPETACIYCSLRQIYVFSSTETQQISIRILILEDNLM